MKNLKTYLVAGFIAFGFTQVLNAQNTTDRNAHSYHQDIYGQISDITDAQKNEIKNAQTQFRNDIKEIKDDKSLSDEARKDKIKTLRKNQQEKISTILTKEQMQELQKIRKEKAQERHEFRKNQPAKKSLVEKLDEIVTLTPEQKTKVEAIVMKFKNEAKKIRKDDSLSDEAKAEKMKTLKKNRKDEIANILTPEQKAKAKEAMAKKKQEKKNFKNRHQSIPMKDAQFKRE